MAHSSKIMIEFLIHFAAHLATLSDAHIGQLIELFGDTLTAIKEGFKAVWAALAPFMIGYLAYRQAMNKRALSEEIDKNTAISNEAFTVANGHNAKIVQLNERVVVAEKVVEEVKSAAEEVKRAADEVKQTILEK